MGPRYGVVKCAGIPEQGKLRAWDKIILQGSHSRSHWQDGPEILHGLNLLLDIYRQAAMVRSRNVLMKPFIRKSIIEYPSVKSTLLSLLPFQFEGILNYRRSFNLKLRKRTNTWISIKKEWICKKKAINIMRSITHWHPIIYYSFTSYIYRARHSYRTVWIYPFEVFFEWFLITQVWYHRFNLQYM